MSIVPDGVRRRILLPLALTALVAPAAVVTAPASSAAPVGAPSGIAAAAAHHPFGFAALNGGTTGGGTAAPVTVTSGSALSAALSGTGAKVVRIRGLLTVSGMLRVPSNTTVEGIGAGSGIRGGGLTVRQARNVVIRNLVFRDAADDSINIEQSTNVWVDHNDLANGYDGLIDVKRGSDYVTVSWNHLHDHDKAALLGHSDDNGAEDRGKLRVTYEHNWFEGTGQRHPRVRFGNPVHVVNNLYTNIGSYGVASTEGAGVLVENNVFENVRDPFHRGEGDSGPGGLAARGNLLTGSGAGQAGGSVAAIPYPYWAQAASGVKTFVQQWAGTGRVGP